MDYMDNRGILVGSGLDYWCYFMWVNLQMEIGCLKFGENVYLMCFDENFLFYNGVFILFLLGGCLILVNDLLQVVLIILLFDFNWEGGFGGVDVVIYQFIILNVLGFNILVNNFIQVNCFLVNVYGELMIVEGLIYKLNLQYDNFDIIDQFFVFQYDLGYFFLCFIVELQVGDCFFCFFLVENILKYECKFGKYDLKFLVGQSFQNFDFCQVFVVGFGLEKFYILSLANVFIFSVIDNQQLVFLVFYFGWVNYFFDDIYFLILNLCYDGFFCFCEENCFVLFLFVGLGWKLYNIFELL